MNDNSYEARHGWTRQTAILMIGCAAFVACAFLPIWSGRVRLDGILMPTAFLPILRIVDILLFGGFLVAGVWRAASKKVQLRVDGAGITFGSGRNAASVIGWTDIHAIELFTRNVQTGRRTVATPYVGVYRQSGAPAVEGASKQAGRRTLTSPQGELVAVSRTITGVDFDRDRFTAAVKINKPDVPVKVSA